MTTTRAKSIFPPSGLDIPMPRRSVVAGSIIGSSVVTGDSNSVTTTYTRTTLPSPETVDVRAELAALRAVLAGLHVAERGKLDRAMEDATEEAAKAEPDKQDIGAYLTIAAKVAKTADDFSDRVEKLLPRIAALGSWLGLDGHALLAAFGLAG
jgi:hypothetical protein